MTVAKEILRQLGPCVLLAIPPGEKGPRRPEWQKLTRADMTPAYLAGLNQGQGIGVLLGAASEGLCTIDVDNTELLETFLDLNPRLRDSVISRGARGGNVWMRVKGHYPAPAKLSLNGRSWGEWRADRNQTVFYGTHPSGCQYSNSGKRPLHIEFAEIMWPAGMVLPWTKAIPGAETAKRIAKDTSIPECTDLGRAQRFLDRFGADLRHVHEWNRWIVFEHGRWNSGNNGAAHRLAEELCKECVAEALKVQGKDERESALCAATAWGSVRIVDNMLGAARNDLRVIVRPEELDGDPWRIGAPNGVCHLRTGEIRTHSRDQLVTKFLGADLDELAPCPRWGQFICEIFPDESVRRFVWKAAGYSLTGQTTEHHFMFLHGRGENGKSTFLEILCAAFGDYAGRAGSRLLYAIDHHGTPDDQVAELFGKRLIIANETQEGTRLNEGTLKDITGGDTLRGCRKYEHGFNFQSSAKLWLAGNHKPAIRGTDDGIWRRVRLVPFERQFGPEERDENLRPKLLAELPGIINWLVQGCLLWQREGLTPPEIVRSAVADYRSEEDTLADFIEECTREDKDSNTSHSDLFKAYQQWSAEMGIKFPLSSKLLAKRLRERGWRDMRTAESKCVWRGIALEE